MSGNNEHENKTEALIEETEKTELSMEELEQVTGGADSGNYVVVTGNGFEYTIPKPYIIPNITKPGT